MPQTKTETPHEDARGLDTRPTADILEILHAGQLAAAQSVAAAVPQIERAAAMAANTISSGGRLGYAAAGSSGLMALADGLELPGTYGVAPERIVILLAGGTSTLSHLEGAPEDNVSQAAQDVGGAALGNGDCVICLSASGTTPYAVGALNAARRSGAATVGIANNAGAPLLTSADVSILLETPPEVVAGSTRMGAATAQKIALNMLSTLMAVRLGLVHDGYMVNLQADNAKLRARAERIVSAIGGCAVGQAKAFLDQAQGSVKAAVLLAAGADDLAAAKQLLDESGQVLRPALSRVKQMETTGSGSERA